MIEPILQKPGAGLPFFETLVARYFFKPYYSKKYAWDESIAHFEKEGRRILELIKPLSPEQLTKRVLIDRFAGIEDNSRYWSILMAVEHLMIVGDAGAGAMVQLSEGKVPPMEVRIENVKPKGVLDPTKIADAYSEFMTRYLAKIKEQIRNQKSATRLRHPWLGPMNVAEWNWLMASHQAIHRQQIKMILKGL